MKKLSVFFDWMWRLLQSMENFSTWAAKGEVNRWILRHLSTLFELAEGRYWIAHLSLLLENRLNTRFCLLIFSQRTIQCQTSPPVASRSLLRLIDSMKDWRLKTGRKLQIHLEWFRQIVTRTEGFGSTEKSVYHSSLSPAFHRTFHSTHVNWVYYHLIANYTNPKISKCKTHTLATKMRHDAESSALTWHHNRTWNFIYNFSSFKIKWFSVWMEKNEGNQM